jgi:pimeloyl-ACP methyl ester carboxylesterase
LAELAFEVSGPEVGIPIVLVPGGLSGWISWKPHAEVLSKKYRVVRVQLLNMSAAEKKQPPENGYSLRSESEALKKTLDKLEIKNVNLVGWSHGGEVSLDFALNNPDYIATLTLIEPAAYWVARGFGKF